MYLYSLIFLILFLTVKITIIAIVLKDVNCYRNGLGCLNRREVLDSISFLIGRCTIFCFAEKVRGIPSCWENMGLFLDFFVFDFIPRVAS